MQTIVNFLKLLSIKFNRSKTFKNRNLKGCNLSNINLVNANFEGANLEDADFKSSKLTRANFKNANLKGANLMEAHLEHADFRSADLSKASLFAANLRWANLSGANLSNADITHADVYEAKIYAAKMTGIRGKEYCNIEDSMNSNPLNIVDDPELNRIHRLPNLVEGFSNDLRIYLEFLQEKNGEEKVTVNKFGTVVIYYAVDLLIEYRNKSLNILPVSIIEDVKTQVLEAAQKNWDVFRQPSIIRDITNLIDKKIWENGIISETHNYLRQFPK